MQLTLKVPFRSIPGHSRIFLDYLDQAPRALKFYQQPPTLAALEKYARETLPRCTFPRAEMADILRRQNAVLGADGLTERNIDELEHPDCAVIITGQQAGLFTGPLYAIHKALTAIRLAGELRGRGLRAVPVFWIECEDHDLAEVTHNTVLAKDHSLRRLDFLDLLYADSKDRPLPVGSRAFPESIRQATSEICSYLPEGISSAEVRSLLESAYSPGQGFAGAFGKALAGLLPGRGLIFFNPTDPDAKRLSAPVYRRALSDAAAVHEDSKSRNHSLESAGYHSQVGTTENSTVLFFKDGAERRALLYHDGLFTLKNSVVSFDLPQLLALAESSPGLFSPNVLLRPLIQDHLFPTAAYIGGPAEVAYFAQIGPLYGRFSRPMPVIWPRASFTLLEPEIAAAMEQSGLELVDCFQGGQKITEKLIESARHASPASRLQALQVEIEKTLREVRPSLVAAEPSLGPALDTAQRKILHHVENLQSKFVQREARQDGALALQAAAILNNCCPKRSLQERELGPFAFLARHGLGIMDTIQSRVNLNEFDHQIILLE